MQLVVWPKLWAAAGSRNVNCIGEYLEGLVRTNKKKIVKSITMLDILLFQKKYIHT